jgi:hypothetical protein
MDGVFSMHKQERVLQSPTKKVFLQNAILASEPNTQSAKPRPKIDTSLMIFVHAQKNPKLAPLDARGN